ncbi:MAG: ATP-binding protein [Gemmatimonadota bacterium]|nr:ATP-binding protein [Gemmatimonadota bacterium]
MQFYEHDDYLAESVADYLAGGFAAGQPLIAIATEPHRQAFLSRLNAKGLPVERACRTGRLTLLDASDTLSTFMENGLPNPERCRATLGMVLERSRRIKPDATLRLYGEMVDVLWREGNCDGAIKLEAIWNDMAKSHSFALLCAYSLGGFPNEAHTHGFEQVCRQHEHVIPTERYLRIDNDARSLEISRLQQRAHSLEAEIERRKQLEMALRDALQSAETANRAKSEFLAVMSHELRTPLNAIGGHVQLVEMGVHGPVTDPQRDALARVQRSQRHLLGLINDLLNLSRAEAGHVEYAIEDVSLASALADVESMVAPLVKAGSLRCELTESATQPLTVRADREKLTQILINLLTNAIKFTPANGRITVEVGACPSEPTSVCIHVRDTGIGIPVGKLESIFEPFVQLTTPPVGERDGVGLGLAISRSLARGMGGDLTAWSTPGNGAALTLTIPRG